MKNKLIIKFKNQTQILEILDDGILVDLNTVSQKVKYEIPFEDIEKGNYIKKGEPDKITIRLYTSVFLNLFLILTLITVLNDAPTQAIGIMFFLMLIPFAFLIVKSSQVYEEKHLKSSKLLYFIYTNKNKNEVDNFIKEIYKAKVDYFRRKYFLIDPVLPYQLQNERYIWLYTNEYIDENEYEVIKDDLDKYFNFNINSIE
jgi:Ca2+/Na+ antiporter